MTRDQLLRFIRIRNRSRFSSNLQWFQIDLQTCGLKIDDLGKPTKVSEGRYEWTTPFGSLVEEGGTLSLIKIKGTGDAA